LSLKQEKQESLQECKQNCVEEFSAYKGIFFFI